MSIQLSQYRNQSFEDLVSQAQQIYVDNAGQLSRAELVFCLVCKASDDCAERPEIQADGLLEVLSDGYGFLRSPVSLFDTGADDIYVSPAQIRRFNLRTGDWVEGLVRTPRENERYLALLRISKVNRAAPEKEKKRLSFGHQSLAIETIAHAGELSFVNKGEAILVQLNQRQHPSDLIFPFVERAEDVVLSLLNYAPEDIGVLDRAWPDGLLNGQMLTSVRGSGSNRHQRALDLGRQRAHRLAEQGRDVHWIISTVNEVALAACSLQEQQGKSSMQSVGVEAAQFAAAERRNLKTTGSLTVWLLGHTERSAYQNDVLTQLGFEVHHLATVDAAGQLSFLS